MRNLESLEDFKSDEISNLEIVFGGEDIPTRWTDGWNSGPDIYDSSRNRIIYL
jgi:hypothetical protein